MSLRSNLWLLPSLVAAGLFAFASEHLLTQPRPHVAPELQVALPLFVQVGMAGGDRYLAANGDVIRGLVTSTQRMGPNEYALLARLQEDASWLNPAHEDNYYTAAAILPWNGQLTAAQTILKRASESRPFDYQPAFFYAFHLLYFEHAPAAAAEWLQRAAIRLPEGNDKLAMQNFAARWVERDKDLDNAINVVSAMAKQARRADFRHYLELRVARMQNLRLLRRQAEIFRHKTGRPLRDVHELIGAGLLRTIPDDPFNFDYDVDAQGVVIVRSEPRQ